MPRPPRFGAAKKNGRSRRAEERMEGERIAAALHAGRSGARDRLRRPSRRRKRRHAASVPSINRRDQAATALRAASSGEEQKSPVRGRARRESGGQWPEPGLFGVAAHSGREVLPDGKTTRPRAPGVEGRRGAGAPSREHVPSGASAPRGRDVASGPAIWSIPTRGRAWRFARGSRDTARLRPRRLELRPGEPSSDFPPKKGARGVVFLSPRRGDRQGFSFERARYHSVMLCGLKAFDMLQKKSMDGCLSHISRRNGLAVLM